MAGIGVVGTVILYALRPEVVTGAVTNPRVLGFGVLVLAVAALLFGLVTALGGPGWLGLTVGVIPLLAAFAWTVLPAFVNTAVNDAPIPTALSDPPMTARPTPSGSTATPPSASPAARKASPSAAPVPAVRVSALRGIGHRASGTARLIPVAGGRYVVRLENLDIDDGPDFLVYLVPGVNRQSPDGGVQLAQLKGNRGNQNYPVPQGTTVKGPRTVLIWCRIFAVPVAGATPR